MSTNSETCCNVIYPAECVRYNGTTNLVAAKNEFLDTILANLGEYAVGWETKYDLTCLGSEETEATYVEAIQAILAEVCTATTPTFDATCIGGTATDTPNEAIAYLITRVCNLDSPSFDLTCLGGTAGSSLSDTIDLILETVCTTPSYDALTYTCLTPPADDFLDSILQALINGIEANMVVYDENDFITEENTCGITLAINEVGLVDKLIVNNTLLEAVNTYVEENININMFNNDTCARNFLADSFVFKAPLEAEKICYSLYSYRLDVTGLTQSTATFEGITLPSGVFYSSGGISISDTAAIETWFADTLDISSVTVSNIATGLTVTFRIVLTTHGDTALVVPSVSTKGFSGDIITSTRAVESVLNDIDDICCKLVVSTEDTQEEVEEEVCEPIIIGRNGVCVDKLELAKAVWSATYEFTVADYSEFIGYDLIKFKILGQEYTTTLQVSNSNNIEFALNSKNIGTFTYSISESPVNTYTLVITYEGYTGTAFSEFIPVFTIRDNDNNLIELSSDLVSVNNEDTCEKYVSYLCAEDWQDVAYKPGFSGDLQYRRNGSKIEVKGGRLIYTGATGITGATTLNLDAFSTSYPPGTASTISVGSSLTETDGSTTTESNWASALWRPNVSFISNNGVSSIFSAFISRVSSGFASIPINSSITSTVSIIYFIPDFSYYE